LEQYVIGSLDEQRLTSVEEHLILCPFCQSRLGEAKDFIRVFRAAALPLTLPRVERPAWYPVLSWGVAVAAVAAILALFIAIRPHRANVEMTMVTMRAERGPDAAATVGQNIPLLLTFDIPATGTNGDYEITVVDRTGNLVFTAVPQFKNGKLTTVFNSLRAGAYWVRVFQKSNKELVEEYGLRVQ
jgi:hypothetical protein